MIIKRKIPIENIISRIPGLFPYIQEDEYGIVKLYKAIDGDNGCYGKVIPDLKVNFTMENPDNDNIIVFESGKFYSYRSLMNNYYRLQKINRPLIPSENTFISFIEEGMGKFEVPSSIKGKLVPSFMFLTEMQEWWEWFQKMKPLCDCTKHPHSINDNDCCSCSEYCDKGGNDMYDFLQNNVNKISSISDKYYNFALDGNKFNGYINLNLLLTTDIDDMGIGLIYSKEWIPGKKYHVGEIVLYNDESWILYEGSGGTNFTICTMNDNNKFDDGFFYYGYYNGSIDEIEFDSAENAHWRRNVTNDISYLTTNCSNKFYKTNTGTNVDLLPINSYYIKDNDSYDKLLASTIDNVETNGVTNSKLISLRKLKRLVDENGETTIPNNESQVDWCCLYEKGIILNIQTWVDDNGNIVYYDKWEDMTIHNILSPGNNINTLVYSNSLIAFGDILEDIVDDKNTHTLTFKYCIGAHLIGGGINSLTSATEPTEYRFNNFTIDSNHKGIQYTETYYYDPETFTYDVNKNPSENMNEDGTQNKGEFYTIGSKSLINSNLGNNGKVSSNILTDFTTKRTEPDYIYSKEYRTDDLIGVSFDPIVDANIIVDRGVNASFERHLKLGEIKTLEDLVNYGNNFFNVKNINE